MTRSPDGPILRALIYLEQSPAAPTLLGISTVCRGTMPKLKTHSGAAKRFKKTGSGRVKRGHAFMRHILTSKTKKTKRRLDLDTMVDKADQPKVKRMIPY
jgi:large subunit ribosomal protein L35